MVNHQASSSMLGYLFQLHCGLYLLISDVNERVSVCLEKYDDVSIVDEEGNQHLYQTKLHTKQVGNLTDSSTDLWRTLKVWIDWYVSNPEQLQDTKFTIITNASALEMSAASKLQIENRDIASAYKILKNIAETSKNSNHQQYYTALLSMSQEKAEQLLHRIFVISNGDDIQTTDSKIMDRLKYSTEPKYIPSLFERLVGWWLKKAEEILISENLVLISLREVQSKIVQIASEYKDDNLPIEDFNESSIQEYENNEKLFQTQLRALSISPNRLRLATKDYYRAFIQRTKWINEKLTYVDELDRYEGRLVEEWEHSFIQMEDELSRTKTVTEKIKQSKGINLLDKMEDKDIRIRNKISEPFVMRGSYHILADMVRIGWHIDYKTLFKLF
jgi:hypothetical protein